MLLNKLIDWLIFFSYAWINHSVCLRLSMLQNWSVDASVAREECAMAVPCRSGSVAHTADLLRTSQTSACGAAGVGPAEPSAVWWTAVRIISGRLITPPHRATDVVWRSVGRSICSPAAIVHHGTHRTTTIPDRRRCRLCCYRSLHCWLTAWRQVPHFRRVWYCQFERTQFETDK